MSKPYAIISDLHLHKWQAFSSILKDGMNSRLHGLISEILRVASEVKNAGGDTIYVAGDVFHVRGSIAPSVLNPVIEAFRQVIEMGVKVRMISGNHDLEGKNSEKLGSAVTSLEGVGVDVCHDFRVFEHDRIIMIPWYEKLDDLRDLIESLSESYNYRGYDLIIHAPLNGVITGLPEHGLSTDEIQKWGFNRVFVGHHHNHKIMGEGVISIGALAHNSWSDVGSKAGFLLVEPNTKDGITWYKSHLPEFIDISEEMTETDVELAADGNYVRAKVTNNKMSTVEAIRQWLTDAGAKGVIVQQAKQAKTARSEGVTASINAGASLEQSVSEYIGSQFNKDLASQIDIASQKILAKANV